MPEISPQILETLYRVRKVDEKLIELYPTDKIKSPVHLSIGQEGTSIACLPLRKDDAVFGSYRSHALYVAKGGDLKRFFAEMYGKSTGCCKGKGGSMHLIDPEAGVMGTSAIVASTIPVAVGWAYASKLRGENKIALVYMGDGAFNEGSFWESLNYAITREIPVIFLCENNKLAIHSKIFDRTGTKYLSAQLRGFNIDTYRAKSFEIQRIFETISISVIDMRKAPHPIFFEIETFRMMEHVGIKTDWHLGYRKEEEAKEWLENDPLRMIKKPTVWMKEIMDKVDTEINEAVKFAEDSPFPEPNALYEDM